MTYCKNYCEEKEISTSELNEAQKTLYYIAENMKANKSISEEGYSHFQMAIKSLAIEPVLDKIKAEIEAIIGEKGMDDYDFCSGLIVARKIIDKYKVSNERKM